MASKPVRVHPEAEQEYLSAIGWYRERSLTAAENFQNAVNHAVGSVAASPQRWPKYFEQFRKYTLRQFPFSVIYQELMTEVVVFAIAHGHRRPGYWKSRNPGLR